MDIKKVVMLVFGLIIIAILLPLGIVYVSTMGDQYVWINGTQVLVSSVIDPSVLTILTIVLPLIVVIAIVIGYIPSLRGKD